MRRSLILMLVCMLGLSVNFVSADIVQVAMTNGNSVWSGSGTQLNGSIFHVGMYYGKMLTYWQYDVSSLAGKVINSAKIETIGSLYAEGGQFTQYLYAVSDDDWTTTTLSGLDLPAKGVLLGTGQTLGAWSGAGDIIGSTAAFIDFVTQEANGDGVVSFLIEGTDLVLDDTWDMSPTQEYSGALNTPYGNASTPVLTVDCTIPEPATMTIMGVGLIGLLRRRYA